MLQKPVHTFVCLCLLFVNVFTSYTPLNDCSQEEHSESVLKSIMATGQSGQTVWYQKEFGLPAKKRGCHLVTEDVEKSLPELKQIKIGLAHIHIKHTSASLALNENWDPDVRKDTEMMLNKIVPEGQNYLHSCEGPDDMPAHIKAALIGSSVTIPVTEGKFNLGTWQGIWLCEHRNHGGSRNVVVTLQGLHK